uniref:uncharacterized protein LOC120326617 n=1 Tax=Styela clava TaxID=7725 RepID=UPI001939A08A|nr:uncharacterized protein LOC120326617 [Styela clava]
MNAALVAVEAQGALGMNDHQMHLYCTNRDQRSIQTDQRIMQGKAGPRGPRGPPGEVDYHIINETINEYFTDTSGQIQANLTQIGPIVAKSSEDIEGLQEASRNTQTKLNVIETDIESASGHTRIKLNEIETDIEGLKSGKKE